MTPVRLDMTEDQTITILKAVIVGLGVVSVVHAYIVGVLLASIGEAVKKAGYCPTPRDQLRSALWLVLTIGGLRSWLGNRLKHHPHRDGRQTPKT